MTLEYRRARRDDHEWVWGIFREGMRSYIEATWGWDEMFQRQGFLELLSEHGFTIASENGTDVGGYCLRDRGRFLYLDILLIDPLWQNRDYGSRIMRKLMAQASDSGRPLQLNVLKRNKPALRLYRRLGFHVFDEDSARLRLRWPDPS